jgi:hypothetical protein
MARARLVSTGLLAFGAGVAVGARWPRSSGILSFILEKLGFQLGDVLLDLWEEEKPAPVKKAASPRKRKRKRKSVGVRRETVTYRRRSVKPKSFPRLREGELVTGLN